MQWGVGWGEVQVEGACREHVVYTMPNWQKDGLILMGDVVQDGETG